MLGALGHLDVQGHTAGWGQSWAGTKREHSLLLLFLFVTACGLNLKLYFIVVRICNMRSTFLKVYNTVSVMLYSRSLKLIHCN